ncbi:hypothetical protein DYB28_007002, partial [Aphanomyces astaci]
FMLLEELGKEPRLLDQLFAGAIEQLAQVPAWPSTIVAPCMLTIHVVSELLRIYSRYKRASEQLTPKQVAADDADELDDDDDTRSPCTAPPSNANPAVMYELSGLKDADTNLWLNVKKLSRASSAAYVGHFFTQQHPTSIDIAIAKHLYRLVTLQDDDVDAHLVAAGLLPKYVQLLQAKPDADMLLIHVVSALLFIITDKSQTRGGSCVLVRGILGDSIDLLQTIVDVFETHHRSKAYFKVLNDSMLVMLASENPSPSQALVIAKASVHAPWQKLNCETKRTLGLVDGVSSAHDHSSTATTATCTTADAIADKDEADLTNGADAAAGVANGDFVDVSEDEPHASTDSEPAKPARRLSLPKSAYLRSVLSSPAASVMRNVNTVKSTSRRSIINIMNLTTTAAPETTATPQPSTKPNINNGSSSTLFGFGNNMLSKLKQRMAPATSPNLHHHAPSSPNESTPAKRSSLLPTSRLKGSSDNPSSLLVLDTSLGDDVTKCAVHDGGVHVTTKDAVVTTSGYMFKSGMPDVGKRHVWERYYFVLERGPEGMSTLSYYISETQAKHRTLVKGVVVPTITGKHEAHAFQFNTQGHGMFWVLVDSKDTKVTWLHELLSAITGIPFSPKSAHEILFPSAGDMSSKQMKAIVSGLYATLFGHDLDFPDAAAAPPLVTVDALSPFVHPNVILSSNLPSTVPYWGEYHGLHGMVQFCKVREETVERLKGRVLRIVADEDESTVVVMTAVTLRIVHNSEVVVEESCDIVELTDGKVATIHLNFDSAQLSTSFEQYDWKECTDMWLIREY